MESPEQQEVSDREKQSLVFEIEATGGDEGRGDSFTPSVWHVRRRVTRRGAVILCVVVALAIYILGLALARPGGKGQQLDVNMYSSPNLTIASIPHPIPFSRLDPVADLGIGAIDRPAGSTPPQVLRKLRQAHNGTAALPTNAWYQNLLLLGDGEQPVASQHRAYTIPYMIDVAGPIPGVRLQLGHVHVTGTSAELRVEEIYGITLGAMSTTDSSMDGLPRRYQVEETTPLAVTLGWNDSLMASPIVKGMAYATMIYNKTRLHRTEDVISMLPTIASELKMSDDVLVDGDPRVFGDGDAHWVQHNIEVAVPESDFTWLIFVSEKVKIQRWDSPSGASFLQVVKWQTNTHDKRVLILRTALVDPCTNGQAPYFCPRSHLLDDTEEGISYGDILRQSAHLYPGSHAQFLFAINESNKRPRIGFDWDCKDTGNPLRDDGIDDLVMFTLPHHRELYSLSSPVTGFRGDFCVDALLGLACVATGRWWNFEDDAPFISFRGRHPPSPWALPDLTRSLSEDIQYRIPDNYQRGAGDTYFSGKMLARLARILLILEEVRDICAETQDSQTDERCSDTTIPGSAETEAALASLRKALDVWLGKDAEAPFVYDTAWRGVASCGCLYEGTGCSNRYPDCPAFTDPGLNFGNAFWNDSHFHYGYFIYACSVVAHFDPSWGISRFEQALLLVRNIANPSKDDRFFPLFRHFDPFQGHSWAGGITLPLSPNGRNQESSSEAIAAYEAVALFGHTMSTILDPGDAKREMANSIASTGSVLLAMELRSAKRYWHVKREDYPADRYQAYDHAVVGIMWQTMFQFQTWFGSAPYLVNGIQMLPLTPIAGDRDDDGDWTGQVYSDLVSSCDAECISSGWSIQQLATLGILGYKEEAFSSAKNLPKEVFETPAGNGHSLSNTLWFIASRPDVADPVSLSTVAPATSPDQATAITCGSSTCTLVLGNVADGHSCADRIKWLMTSMALSEVEACSQVADEEFPDECGGCTFQSSPPSAAAAAPEETPIPCGNPGCTSSILNNTADDHTCGDRIQWLMTVMNLNESAACFRVAVTEYPSECGGCS